MKQIALTHGPQGFGFLGNFISLVTLSTGLAGGGIISGIIKYTTEYSKESDRQNTFWGNALVYSLLCSALVFILGWLFIQSFSNYIFLSPEFQGYIYFFLFVQIFISLNNVAFGICNGLKRTGLYSTLIILGNVIAFIVSSFAIPHYGFWGAIISIASPAVASFFPLLVYGLVFTNNWRIKVQWNSFLEDSKSLSHYSIMLLCGSLCFPLVEMTLRNMIVQRVDLLASGYWQATTRLSMAYLSFFSLFLSVYFVPLVVEIKERQQLLMEVKHMVVFILMLFIPMMFICYLLKEQLIALVYSSTFFPVEQWLLIQMLGDLFRVLGWIVGFIIVAKACTKLYVVGEICQGGIFIVLSIIQLNKDKGVEGVVFASMITGILYCIISFLGLFLYLWNSQVIAFFSKKFNLKLGN